MKLILFFILYTVVVCDLSLEWDKFKRDYNKQYATVTEETERKQVFSKNVNQMHSYQQTHPDATFRMAINHLADQNIEDLVSKRETHFQTRPALFKNSIELKNFPESLDWRTKGVISSVFPTSQIGEIDIAVVSTELVETLYAIENGQLIEGSIPQVFDCCPQPIDVFNCINNLSGICRKNDYPDIRWRCESNKCTPFTTFDTINRLTDNDENKMVAWIQVSTLWAELDASEVDFMMYSGGVYNTSSCSQTTVDHVVQIIGYGTEEGIPYWLCPDWGEKGYFRIARGKNMCGISNVVIQVANSKKSGANQ
ncbi:unnamed protein product [Adineta steineri]|uniref:Uncharacterized protein n=1 Tax=Adineta steineri TaxID=433720 RepID=A0A819ZBE5_9BILA|nr:unnamed protein product [Adineta steineri]CAF4167439.1 unnamed protein product [Adineta steineri]